MAHISSSDDISITELSGCRIKGDTIIVPQGGLTPRIRWVLTYHKNKMLHQFQLLINEIFEMRAKLGIKGVIVSDTCISSWLDYHQQLMDKTYANPNNPEQAAGAK